MAKVMNLPLYPSFSDVDQSYFLRVGGEDGNEVALDEFLLSFEMESWVMKRVESGEEEGTEVHIRTICPNPSLFFKQVLSSAGIAQDALTLSGWNVRLLVAKPQG